MSEMEIIEDSEEQTKCYKCKEQLYGTLNIVQKDCERSFILWNKYQMFLYEDLNFDAVAKTFTPDFQVNQVIVSNNYMICVDCNGNVHTTPLKFKNVGQKILKTSFQPRELGILYCLKYSRESTLSLKLQADSYFLCLHKINAEFQIESQIALTVEDTDWPLHSSDAKTCILSCHTISKQEFSSLCHIFKETAWKNHSLVLISFDKQTIYACMFSPKSSDDIICLKKLYTSPAEICDIKIIEKEGLEVFIGLTCGTLVQLVMKSLKKAPEVIHLNTAISKFMPLNSDVIVYSDGTTMWKAENLRSRENIDFEQFHIREVKDFVKYNELLICTTFSNLIYMFSIKNVASYVNQDKSPYCPAEKLLRNSDYLFKINQEIEKNKEIIKKISNEENHLTIVSLSKRQDVMDKFIQENVIVYENYQDVNENSEIILTEELVQYFSPEAKMILIKLTTANIQHNLSNILTNVLGNLKVHVTFYTEGKSIKTTTVKLSEPLRKLQILIPLERKNISQIEMELKLVSEIPGPLESKETIWSILHRKNIKLNAEQFIKITSKVTANRSLKDKKNIKEMIIKNAEKCHGELFKFTDISSAQKKNLSFYVKLPQCFAELLKDDKIFKDHFNNEKAGFMQKLMTSEEFLKSKCNVFFEIGIEKVFLEIINDDFSNPLLKISCNNMRIAFQIRNFFSIIFYGTSNNYPEEEYISNALYTTTENLQKELKKCSSSEECLMLAEKLQKNVIAALPL